MSSIRLAGFFLFLERTLSDSRRAPVGHGETSGIGSTMRAIRNIGVGEFSRPQMDRAINEERDSFRDPETRGYRFGGRKIFVNESFFSRKRTNTFFFFFFFVDLDL